MQASFKLAVEAFLEFAMHKDLQLYVAEKLDASPIKAPVEGNVANLLLSAMYPDDFTGKGSHARAHRRMVDLLFSKGLTLNTESVDFSDWNIFLDGIFSHWQSPDYDESIFRLKVITSQMKSGRPLNAASMSMVWVETLFRESEPFDWAAEYKEALIETLLTVFERGADPNRGMGDAWQCLLKSSYEVHILEERGLPPRAEEPVFQCVQAILRHGASQDCTVYKSGVSRETERAEQFERLWQTKQDTNDAEGLVAVLSDRDTTRKSLLQRGMQDAELKVEKGIEGRGKESKVTSSKRFTKLADLTVKELLVRIFPKEKAEELLATPVERVLEQDGQEQP